MRARVTSATMTTMGLLATAWGAAGGIGCGDDHGGAPPSSGDNVAEVTSTLLAAPNDARCLVFTATPAVGTPVVQQFPVTPGQLGVFDLKNLPFGMVTLVEQAFTATCPVAPGTAPNWASSPVTVTLTAGVPIALTFNLVRVDNGGQVTATTNFPPPANQLVEFLPSNVSIPDGITAGPDGNLWVAVAGGIARVTPAGDATVFTSTTAAATALTNGPDGNIWFTDFVFSRVGRITLDGTITEFNLPTAGAGPSGIVAGRDGMLYFAEFNGNQLGRVTTGGTITEFAVPTASSGPVDVAAASDNNIWFTEFLRDRIARFNTSTGAITEFVTPTIGGQPNGITAGPDGALWFTERGSGRIGRMTLAGAVVEFKLPNPAAAPDTIITGPDGNLWFAEPFGPAIARITPLGVITEFFVSAAAQPVDVTPGPDGNIWFTEIGGAPGIAHIAP